jgi:hypothetical protein
MTRETSRTTGGLPLLLLAIAVGVAATTGARANTLLVGADKTYKLPSEAIAAAASGDTVRIDPGEYFDCAVVKQDNLKIEGVGTGATMTDKACQGKALLVTTGHDITISNLTLTRARVPDNNGAGIRAEGANLTVQNTRFINNENGILSSDNPDSTIRIINSTFEHNGRCTQFCAHGVYAGHIKLLRIEGSTFTDTLEGHHVKSRALRTEIVNSSIQDGPDGTASYLVEIPNGGALVMTNDTLEKGPKCENHSAAIVIGAEGVTQRTQELTFANITFTNDWDGQTIFVRNITATEAKITGAKFKGHPIKPLDGDGSVG